MAARAPWFKDGLRFTCTQCSHCCTGEPGVIYLSEADADAMAGRLGMDPAGFRARYCVSVHARGRRWLSLRDRPDATHGHACVMWAEGVGCTVYEQRPRQCRTWPFWRRIVADPAAWAAEAAQCPGMGHGRLHTAAAIAATAADDGLPR